MFYDIARVCLMKNVGSIKQLLIIYFPPCSYFELATILHDWYDIWSEIARYCSFIL